MIYIDTEFVVELLGAAHEGPPIAKQLMALCREARRSVDDVE